MKESLQNSLFMRNYDKIMHACTSLWISVCVNGGGIKEGDENWNVKHVTNYGQGISV